MQLQVDLRSRGSRVLDICEVACSTGLPASTLRFYEEQGLIRSIGRRGLKRLFDADVVERLAFIGLARESGFSLDEIATLFGPDGRPRIDRQKLVEKADELDATIRKLSRMSDGLRHAAVCRAPSHMECPTFQRLLAAVTTRAIQARRRKARRSNRLRR